MYPYYPYGNPFLLYKSLPGYSALMAWYEERLSRLNLPYEARIVPTRYGPTHLLVMGPKEAPPVVLLSGLDDNALMWQAFLPDLMKSYRLFVVDIIGTLGKSAVVLPPVQGPDYGYWLWEVLNACYLPQAAFIGYRGGCMPITKLANLDVRRITKTMLINPSTIVPSAFTWMTLSVLPKVFYASLLFNLSPSIANGQKVVRAICVRKPTLSNELLEQEVSLFTLAKQHIKMNAMLDQHKALPAYEHQHLIAPTYLLTSKYDANYSAEAIVQQAKQVFTNLYCEIVPANYLLLVEQTELVKERMRQFLAASFGY